MELTSAVGQEQYLITYIYARDVAGWCNLNEDGDRCPVDYDIMRFDEVFGWLKIGRYDKIAEMIFEK
jgi:hypothetical protein